MFWAQIIVALSENTINCLIKLRSLEVQRSKPDTVAQQCPQGLFKFFLHHLSIVWSNKNNINWSSRESCARLYPDGLLYMGVTSWSSGGQCSPEHHTYIPDRKEKFWSTHLSEKQRFLSCFSVNSLLMRHQPGQPVILPGREAGKQYVGVQLPYSK